MEADEDKIREKVRRKVHFDFKILKRKQHSFYRTTQLADWRSWFSKFILSASNSSDEFQWS